MCRSFQNLKSCLPPLTLSGPTEPTVAIAAPAATGAAPVPDSLIAAVRVLPVSALWWASFAAPAALVAAAVPVLLESVLWCARAAAAA